VQEQSIVFVQLHKVTDLTHIVSDVPLDAFRVLCPSPLAITIEMHEAALKIAEKQGYNICDALVVSAALEAGCTTLYSEDLRDGQTIDGQLTIRNPFVGSSG
jgi:predicted nucleic acid-binding protein